MIFIREKRKQNVHIKLNGARKKWLLMRTHMGYGLAFSGIAIDFVKIHRLLHFPSEMAFDFVRDYYVHHLVFSCMRSCRALLGE